MSELEAELEQLSSALEERGAQLRDIIGEEKQRKEAELQVQIGDLSCLQFCVYSNIKSLPVSFPAADFRWKISSSVV